MWMLEAVWRFTSSQVVNVVGAIKTDASRNPVQRCSRPHAVGYGVIGASAIAAKSQPPDHLPPRIQRDPATEGDNASVYLPKARPQRQKRRVGRNGMRQS